MRVLLLAAFATLTAAFSPSAFMGSPTCLVQSSAPAPARGVGSTITMIRHGNRLKKLSKPADQRKALLRALTTEVIRYGFSFRAPRPRPRRTCASRPWPPIHI